MFSGSTLPCFTSFLRAGERAREVGPRAVVSPVVKPGKGQGKQAQPERPLGFNRPRPSFYTEALGLGVQVFRTERKDWGTGRKDRRL